MSEKKKEEKIFKTFRTIVIKADDQEEGVIDMLIPMSTGSIDRHGESIDPKGWKKHLKAFKKRAIMTSTHRYQGLQNQIGEFLDLQITEKGLLARPKYYINQGNPEADWGYFLATKGKAAYSVGFIPIKWEDSDGKEGKASRTFTEQELIEIAHVIVPSNRDAIQGLQAKSEDPVMKEIIDEIIEDKDFFIKEEENYLIDKEGKKTKEIIAEVVEGSEENVEDIIKDKLKDVKADPIDPEKVKASIEKDEEEDKRKAVGIFDVQELADIVNRNKELVIENKDLEEKLKDIELKAGAVLNAKNKSNLKNAQALIQSVLDSAETEEGQEGEGEKDNETDDKMIIVKDNKKEDPGKDEKTGEKTILINDEVIKSTVSKVMNYTLGINK